MNEIRINWEHILDVEEFYDTFLYQVDAPEWHGRNIDALSDSLVTGGINRNDLPYHFIFSNFKSPHLEEFKEALVEIASLSISEHGGNLEIQV